MELVNLLKLGTMGFKPADIKKINEAGINTDQIIDLAKNGYSTADVNELITLTQDQVDSTQPAEDVKPKEPEGANNNPGDNASEDYKKELEQKTKELDELKKTVSDLQNKIVSRNVGGGNQVSNREKFQEALKGLY